MFRVPLFVIVDLATLLISNNSSELEKNHLCCSVTNATLHIFFSLFLCEFKYSHRHSYANFYHFFQKLIFAIFIHRILRYKGKNCFLKILIKICFGINLAMTERQLVLTNQQQISLSLTLHALSGVGKCLFLLATAE